MSVRVYRKPTKDDPRGSFMTRDDWAHGWRAVVLPIYAENGNEASDGAARVARERCRSGVWDMAALTPPALRSLTAKGECWLVTVRYRPGREIPRRSKRGVFERLKKEYDSR